MRTFRLFVLLSLVAALSGLLAACSGAAVETERPRGAVTDVSGIAWAGADSFLVVHDAKTPDEDGRARVSLVRFSEGAAPDWTPLAVAWPPGGPPSHDLESIARIPGTALYLLAESGDDGTDRQRIFVVDLGTGGAVREVAAWPEPVFNVEGSAAFRRGGALYFAFAERAHGEAQTEVVWGRLSLDPFGFEAGGRAPVPNPLPGPDARPVSALDVTPDGRLLAAAASDPGDDGPFRSGVWEVGRIVEDGAGRVHLRPHARPVAAAVLDGVKVEGVTVVEGGLVVGTDDENGGGALRWVRDSGSGISGGG